MTEGPTVEALLKEVKGEVTVQKRPVLILTGLAEKANRKKATHPTEHPNLENPDLKMTKEVEKPLTEQKGQRISQPLNSERDLLPTPEKAVQAPIHSENPIKKREESKGKDFRH